MEIKATLLGTGTSQGVPVIGCNCEVCTSTDPRDNRLRTAALIQTDGASLAIDCGPDFRQQMLRARVSALDAIIFTHEHNDHIIGLDDVRPFNFKNWSDLPVYATEQVGAELRRRFAYIFEENRYPGAPMVQLRKISRETPFEVNGLQVIPVEVMHGNLPVLAFRIGNFAYVTDIRTIEPPEMRKLEGLDVLVLGVLHHQPHHSHLNLEQALTLIELLQPGMTYLTHISHRMGKHEEINSRLPPGVELGYDGLEIITSFEF